MYLSSPYDYAVYVSELRRAFLLEIARVGLADFAPNFVPDCLKNNPD
jgi:hypothetical protein